mmetsp:Transcript_6321/g.13954  ORF Transcript_6321/g.13954 Transcript_6321/m.13954 type:complete len:367 (-) Transcript_6321:835-1935(-)
MLLLKRLMKRPESAKSPRDAEAASPNLKLRGADVLPVSPRDGQAKDASKEVNILAADNVEHQKVVVLLSGLLYISTSASLILLNKHALASFQFHCPNALLLLHCLLAVFLVKMFEVVGWIKLEPLKWSIIKIWFPVNLLFVGMIVTSFFSLKLIGVAMFTLLKNLSNFITIIGDWYFFGRTYSLQVWCCLILMVGSACFGGYTDLRFSLEGYMWQLLNCIFTSAYALYLSGTMDRVAQFTTSKERMTEFSMVYYNNLLSIGPILILMLGYGEVITLPTQAALTNPEFIIVALVGGLLGFGISFTSLWYMSRTTATVYSLTGSLNKILVAVAGILLFAEPTTLRNLMSIVVGLAAGVIFVLAKAYGR